MPDWKSPEELQKDAQVFTKFMHSLLGIYAYEWFISLDFDWEILTGKKKFRWPMIFYYANRYLLLFAMIGIAIALDTDKEVNCQTLYTFNQIAGDAAVGLASINLSIRTMAVWSQNRYIVALLVVIILGHWSIILAGVQLTAVWIPGVGCAITGTNNKIQSAIFIYSMCFDLTVFLLNLYKLLGIGSSDNARRLLSQSRLTTLVFKDGLIFFFIAFLANLIATVFMLLNLNQIMSVIFNVPAAVFSTIVATRAVRRLTNFSFNKPEVYGASSNNRGATSGTPATRAMQSLNYKPGSHPGVHVQMETFTHNEDQADIFTMSKSDSANTDLDIEAKGPMRFDAQ